MKKIQLWLLTFLLFSCSSDSTFFEVEITEIVNDEEGLFLDDYVVSENDQSFSDSEETFISESEVADDVDEQQVDEQQVDEQQVDEQDEISNEVSDFSEHDSTSGLFEGFALFNLNIDATMLLIIEDEFSQILVEYSRFHCVNHGWCLRIINFVLDICEVSEREPHCVTLDLIEHMNVLVPLKEDVKYSIAYRAQNNGRINFIYGENTQFNLIRTPQPDFLFVPMNRRGDVNCNSAWYFDNNEVQFTTARNEERRLNIRFSATTDSLMSVENAYPPLPYVQVLPEIDC
jgi:hypothetical protein